MADGDEDRGERSDVWGVRPLTFTIDLTDRFDSSVIPGRWGTVLEMGSELADQSSDGDLTARDAFQAGGSLLGGSAGGAVGFWAGVTAGAPGGPVGMFVGGALASVGCVLARTTLNAAYHAQNGA